MHMHGHCVAGDESGENDDDDDDDDDFDSGAESRRRKRRAVAIRNAAKPRRPSSAARADTRPGSRANGGALGAGTQHHQLTTRNGRLVPTRGGSGGHGGRRATTLIVCPTSLLSQWHDQIVMHTTPGALSVYLYYGGARVKDAAMLSSYDVVLTTYGVLASDYAAQVRETLVHSTVGPVPTRMIVLS